MILKKYFAPIGFYKELVKLVFPIAFQQLLSTGMAFFQTLLVGNWAKGVSSLSSAETLLSIQIGNRFFISMNALLMAVSIMCSLFFAQYKGANDKEKVKEVAKSNVILSFAFSLLFVIIGLVFKHQIVQSFYRYHEIEKEYIVQSENFYIIILFSLLPLSLSHSLTYMLRNMKMTKIPLIATGISFVIHALVSSILLYGSDLGIKGVAISFLLTRIIEMGILLTIYRRKKTAIEGFIHIKEYRDTLKNIIQKGWPVFISALLQEALVIMMFLSYAKIKSSSLNDISSITFTTQIVDVCYAIIGGMGTATAIYIGEPIGKGKKEEAKKNSYYLVGYIVVFSLVLSILMLIFLPIYQGITEKSAFFVQIFLLQSFTLPFLFYSQNVMFILRSSGYTKSNLWISILPTYLIKVPIVLLFIFIFPNLFMDNPILSDILSYLSLTPNVAMFIFLSERLIEIIRGIVAFFLFHRVKWYRRNLKGKEEVTS